MKRIVQCLLLTTLLSSTTACSILNGEKGVGSLILPDKVEDKLKEENKSYVVLADPKNKLAINGKIDNETELYTNLKNKLIDSNKNSASNSILVTTKK